MDQRRDVFIKPVFPHHKQHGNKTATKTDEPAADRPGQRGTAADPVWEQMEVPVPIQRLDALGQVLLERAQDRRDVAGRGGSLPYPGLGDLPPARAARRHGTGPPRADHGLADAVAAELPYHPGGALL